MAPIRPSPLFASPVEATSNPPLCGWYMMCAWHDAQTAVPGEAWGIMVRRYRTEGRRRQGKGITRKWGV